MHIDDLFDVVVAVAARPDANRRIGRRRNRCLLIRMQHDGGEFLLQTNNQLLCGSLQYFVSTICHFPIDGKIL